MPRESTQLGQNSDRLALTLGRFRRAEPELVDKRRLLKRTDSKFLMSAMDVGSLLERLAPSYAILCARDTPMSSYRTLYFDTLDYRCFHDHRRGQRQRFKARIRHYDDRVVSFLEVKTKNGTNITSKARMTHAFRDDSLSREDRAFLSEQTPVSGDQLHPVLWTNFSRLTLLSLHGPERVTIDLNLNFVSRARAVAMTDLAIVEVKQASYCSRTPMMRELSRRHIQSTSVSKYCTAIQATRCLRPNAWSFRKTRTGV